MRCLALLYLLKAVIENDDLFLHRGRISVHHQWMNLMCHLCQIQSPKTKLNLLDKLIQVSNKILCDVFLSYHKYILQFLKDTFLNWFEDFRREYVARKNSSMAGAYKKFACLKEGRSKHKRGWLTSSQLVNESLVKGQTSDEVRLISTNFHLFRLNI